jgi:large subunit ribosomal protein L28
MKNKTVLTISTKINEQDIRALFERDRSSFPVMKVIGSHETAWQELDFHLRVWYSILSPPWGKRRNQIMAQRCEICGKGPLTGSKISHAHNVTKRRWLPNLHRVRAMVDGRPTYIKVCTRCIRSGKVIKAPRGQQAAAAVGSTTQPNS